MLNKKLIISVIIIALAASAVVLAYVNRNAKELVVAEPVAVDNNKQEINNNKKKITATTTNGAAASTEKVDTSDWQTYRNEEYGFEIKYQPYWEKAAYGIYNKNIISLKLFNDKYTTKQKDVLPVLSFMVVNNKFDKIPAKEDISNIKIGSLNLWVHKSKHSYAGFKYFTVINLKNKNFLLVQISQIVDKNLAWERFRQIISTFQFID